MKLGACMGSTYTCCLTMLISAHTPKCALFVCLAQIKLLFLSRDTVASVQLPYRAPSLDWSVCTSRSSRVTFRAHWYFRTILFSVRLKKKKEKYSGCNQTGNFYPFFLMNANFEEPFTFLLQVWGLLKLFKKEKKMTGNSSQRLRVDGRMSRGDFVCFDMELVLLQY